MKLIYTLILSLLVLTTSYATKITAVQNNNWSDKATWDLGRLPKNGDTILIPVGFTVTVDNNNNLNNVVIITYGTLKLDNGKLKLDNSSSVIIESTGKITGQGNNDQISIGGVFKFKGTQGTQTGYAYADSSTGSSPTGFIMSALPVNFTAFYAKRTGNNVVLEWSTASEINNSHFEIEKSADGRNWRMIGLVIGNGTTSMTSNYQFIEKNETSAVLYYRIIQVDQNGQKSYSSVKVISNTDQKQVANIYATSRNSISIDMNGETNTNMLVTILNMNGQVVAKQMVGSVSYKASIVVSNAVPGIYIVNVRDEKGWFESKKVIL